jgi:hypothetical protein
MALLVHTERFTSTLWYAFMNWSSSGSVSAARPPSAVCCRASISLALMASTHASGRLPPLASYSTELPPAPLFPVAATVFRVSGRPARHCGDATRDVVQDIMETVAARFQRDPADVE